VVGGVDEEQELVGSLNIYGNTHPRSTFDEELMRCTALRPARRSPTRALQHSRATGLNSSRHLVSRWTSTWPRVPSLRCTAAIHKRRSPSSPRSQRRNIKLRDIALEGRATQGVVALSRFRNQGSSIRCGLSWSTKLD
jgi:hypothetical protein